MPASRSTAALLTLAALALGASACGGEDDEDSGSAPAPAAATVDIKDFKFVPPEIEVKAGGKVTFVNSDRAGHTASASDDSFDTDSLDGGRRTTVVVAKAGSHSYICDFHPYMKGTVVAR